MIGNVVGAVAVVTAAPGAVAELQIRVRDIGPSADGAFVSIWGLYRCVGRLVGTGGMEGDGLLGGIGGFFYGPAGIDTPAPGENVENILSKKQEIVSKRNDGEQIHGEGSEKTQQNDDQIDQSEDPGLYRNDKEDEDLSVGEEGGIGQEETHVQISRGGSTAEDHAIDVHQENAGKVENVESEGSPDVLNGLSQRIIAQEYKGGQKDISAAEAEWVGDQTPDLSL